MADMASDLLKYKTKTAHSSAPVENVYNTGLANEQALNEDTHGEMASTPEAWAARDKMWKKHHEWQEFWDGEIEPSKEK